jgi:hypothetical protein
MPDSFEIGVRKLLDQRMAERRKLDADIENLRAILLRRGTQTEGLTRRRAGRGEVRAALLNLFADGDWRDFGDAADELGRDHKATYAALRRLAADDGPFVQDGRRFRRADVRPPDPVPAFGGSGGDDDIPF